MRRRLEIARALLGRPSVLFLDEPTLGLDPIARQDLWQTVGLLRARERVTVLLSTHYLEEAETVCDRVAIVDRGEIIALGTPAELIDRVGRQMLELRVEGDATALLLALRDLGEPLVAGGTVSVPGASSPEDLSARATSLGLSQLGVRTMTVRPTTLNDVFLVLTSHGANRALTAAGVLS
jgi:ABC-type multidrug transport system ATPase subunit